MITGEFHQVFSLQDLQAKIDALRSENARLRAALEAALEGQRYCPKCLRSRSAEIKDGVIFVELNHEDDCIIGQALGLTP